MANTEFQIGRGTNLAVRFALGASGAGAGASGGLPAIGTSLLNQGAGGSTAVGQTMSSLTGAQPQKVPLLERLKSGMSAISPEFANAQDLKSLALQRQSTTQLNTAQLEKTRMDNQILPLDKITSSLTPTARQKVEDTLTREGLIIEEGGIKGIRTGAANLRMKEMFDEPKEQLDLHQTMRKDYEDDIKKVEFHRERHINTLIDKELKDKGLKEGSVELKTARDNIRKLIVEDGLIGSPELKGYDSEREALKGRLQPVLDNEQMILQQIQQATVKLEPYVTKEGNFIDSFVPNDPNIPQGAMPLEVFKETRKQETPSTQRFNIMNSDEYKQDMEEAEQMLRTLREGGQILDGNGKPINITEQKIIDFVESKYSTISKDVTRRLKPIEGGREF